MAYRLCMDMATIKIASESHVTEQIVALHWKNGLRKTKRKFMVTAKFGFIIQQLGKSKWDFYIQIFILKF